jgi:hypothetical protein
MVFHKEQGFNLQLFDTEAEARAWLYEQRKRAAEAEAGGMRPGATTDERPG